MINQELQQKETTVKEILGQYSSVAIAFSAGVDSTLLLYMAGQVLGKNAVAIMADGPMVPAEEKEEAKKLAAQMGVDFQIISLPIMELKEFVENGPKRCYYCKREIFTAIIDTAKNMNAQVIMDGTNADDQKDYRPGRVALEELGVQSPFLMAGLTKAEIRILSDEYGLSTARKPAMACLATRIPTGTPITVEALSMVEQGEQYLKGLGLSQYRLRILGTTGRIECPQEELHIVQEQWEQLCEQFKTLGFTEMQEPAIYQCGSMNQMEV